MDKQAVLIALLVLVVFVLAVYSWHQYQQKQKQFAIDSRLKPVQDIMVATVVKYQQKGCKFANPQMVMMALSMMAEDLCDAHVKNDINATLANIRARMGRSSSGVSGFENAESTETTEETDFTDPEHPAGPPPGMESGMDTGMGAGMGTGMGMDPSMMMSMLPPMNGEMKSDADAISDELIKLYAQIAMNICADGKADTAKLEAISKQIYNNLCNSDRLERGLRQGVLSRMFDATVVPLLGPHANGAGMTMKSTSAASGDKK